METYKHSCPICGQHIEYTVEYCGKQMSCPTCGRTVTFPAIPPGGKRQALHIKRQEAIRRSTWSFNLTDMLRFAREFEHWNVVLMCSVPFVIIVVLLVGAHIVQKTVGEEPAAPVVPRAEADPDAWKKMTDLAKADQQVQAKIAIVLQAQGALAQAQMRAKSLHASYDAEYNNPLTDRSTREGIGQQFTEAERSIAQARAALTAARQAFETCYANYQSLGGQVDYRRQLPP